MQNNQDNKEFDFYTMGIRYAKEMILNLHQAANEIGEKYGEDAKMEFEAGIVSTIPYYRDANIPNIDDMKGKNIVALDETDYLSRNNSYFGSSGTGKRFRYADGKYIEPNSGNTESKEKEPEEIQEQENSKTK